MDRMRKRGFTLVELMVVLAIMAIIIGIAVPSIVNYRKLAEFRENESNAKTVYLAAESRLAYYRNSGQWESFRKEVLAEGQAAVLPEGKSDRIYGITLDGDGDDAVRELLDGYTYDKDMLNAGIAIEVDIESGQVYSAFYGTRCKGLDYSADDHDGILTMQKRSYDERKPRLLGYYSVEDTVNVVELKPKRLKVTSINLVNGETLALNWSSNVGTSLDVDYEISFYKKAQGGEEDSLLFGVSVSPSDMRTHGWTTDQESTGNLASLPVTKAESQTADAENWSFPVTVQDGKYVLTLDAMMSAEVTEAMARQPENSDVLKTSSVSITRLARISEALKDPQNIYATVKAVANYSNMTDAATDYRASEEVFSNVANTMFANDSEEGNEKIAAFRHLSNIRYYKKESANFTLTSKNMDWTSVGTGLYDFALEQQAGSSIRRLVWKENQKENAQDFPTVPLLKAGYSLTGNGQNTRISNVWLGEDSVLKDSDADLLGSQKAAYLGLFGEVEGRVQNLYFQDPYLELTAENIGIAAAAEKEGESATLQPVTDHNALTGVGILAGRSQGSLTNIEVQVTKAEQPTVRVALAGDGTTAGEEKAVGGIVGILAGKAVENDAWESLQAGTFRGLKMNGTVEASVPEITLTADKNRTYTAMSGIGGIIGYAFMNGSANAQVTISNCENHAAVSGNQYTGGIVGNIRTQWSGQTQGDVQNLASLKESTSDGLILCTADSASETTEGHYFGGIAGYANRTVIYNATSASGRAAGFSYDGSKQNLLKGTYVGGIAGYGRDAILSSCSTRKGGYILGAEEVGGIIGALEGASSLQATSEVKVTTNASYVIGNTYVGGIVGHNENGKIENCINNGVAAGYDQYVGGITGYNGAAAVINDCASYLSDYDSSVFRMIVDSWKATADYAGGIAGYNNGAICFDQASEHIVNKSVSSIVVGRNYVGGIAGFNDVNGTLDVHYTMIGGRIYASEDCAGGAFGFNASEKVLDQELTIQPQSVQGRYYVGGIIGANVVKLSNDITVDKFRADNRLGSVTAQAFCGGLIGYHRTYDNDVAGPEDLAKLLPGLDKDNVPGSVKHISGRYRLTITAEDKTINNLPIRAYLYAGGVVGFSEEGSSLRIQNCINEGNIAFPSKGTFSDSSASKGVSLGDFAKSRISGSLSDNAKDITLHLTGGIIGVNLSGQTVDSCSNKGAVSGFSGAGGIVGLNAGLVKNCELSDNFGNAALSYLGGIVGINLYGEVQDCTTRQNKTVSGKNCTGGIAGWNLNGGTIRGCTSLANINAGGNAAGGVAGRNTGMITLADEKDHTEKKTISGKNSVGGVVGLNEASGKLELAGNGTSGEQIVVGSGVSVSGQEKVGGIVGENYGDLGESGAGRLVSTAASVRASSGYAGGIAGWTSGNIYNAENRARSVAADKGNAGGITAFNQKENTISGSTNIGNVTASAGYAGGIAAENEGIITGCEVKNGTIQSRGVQEAGAICAVNQKSGTIFGSMPSDGVILNSNGLIFGGIIGRNQGTVTDAQISKMPELQGSTSGRTVGGAVGVNEGTVSRIKAGGLTFENFSGYTYLGGIAGDNRKGTVTECEFSGKMTETADASAGSCYGGIVGLNQATLENCKVQKIWMNIKGIYTATSTSTEEEKEKLSSHAGGIAGKNEKDAVIDGCILEITDTKNSELCAKYGMLGGITGYNKGTITMSGDTMTSRIMKPDSSQTVEELHQAATDAGLQADSTFVAWDGRNNIDEMKYNGTTTMVKSDRFRLYMDVNGNLGGITAYNGTTGSIDYCVSGNWFLANKSSALGVGTGGIIGMNESGKDLSYLVNGAFVGRQLTENATNRFAGGIIGNQNNSTGSSWNIKDCLNYGTVYCYKTHYSGGIIGQWTGTGGTIEACRNYGNLQTTYGTDWVGASGGIVAQLYHAYEGQEYNIISCENYGNIYTREGTGFGNGSGANDSAGILGNVTTYLADSVESGQTFTIQILDCVNAPGVEIYSASMASGIFGFLSCDTPTSANVETSTQNVQIRIERCRNFASVLKGRYYTAGIFGDRYGANVGWKQNMIVKDNISLNLDDSHYYGSNGGAGWPVYARGNWKGNSGNMKSENRGGNYYLDTDSWSNVVVSESKENQTGKGLRTNNEKNTGLNDRYAYRACFMYDPIEGKYFVADLRTGQTANGQWCYLDAYGYIRATDTDNIIGERLYYVDNASYDGNYFTTVYEKQDNVVFQNARSSWRRLEGIQNGKLIMPKTASASISNGRMTMKITPQWLPGSASRKCDPFLYEVQVSEGDRAETYRLYTEEGSFVLPSGFSENAVIKVRAVSMYEDVEPSDWLELDKQNINRILPEPDIRVTLVENGDAPYTEASQYAYQFSLNNLDAYEETGEDGNALYPDWQVNITIPRVGEVVLDASRPTATRQVTYKEGANTIYQMTAQATATSDGAVLMQDSREVSVPVNLPAYRPPMSLKEWEPLTVKTELSGTTQEDLAVTVTLDAGSTRMDTPPVYRAELVGTWNDVEDTIFAKTDLLLVSAGTVSGTFSNLPEYIRYATDLKIRIWYAASGLGPVYTWYDLGDNPDEMTDADKAAVNLKELVSVESAEDGTVTETWNYGHSSVLSSTETEHYFGRYRYDGDTLLTWLPAPVLENVGAMPEPDAEQLKNGKIAYTFSWDQNSADAENASYEVSMTGLDENGNQVLIDLGDAYREGAKSLTVDASDWNYQSVELKVTRIGDAEQKQIGLSSTGTYPLKQRLASPGQPSVENMDVNELDYQLTWAAVDSENGCRGYQAYIRIYNENGELGEAEPLFAEPVALNQKTDGTYQERLTLKEEWAGKKTVIYLVALADNSGNYLDSADGIYYELTIPERLKTPAVTWNPGWATGKEHAVSADVFRDGLKLSLTGDVTPPGGSAYLLKGYLYESAEEAKAALEAKNPAQGAIATYPATEDGGDKADVVPVQMDASGLGYEHTMSGLSIEYAGKYMVFYTRISSGSSSMLSSAWVASDPMALPCVQLDTPGVSSGETERKVTATVKGKNPDLEEQEEEQEWTVTNTVLTWTEVDCADAYEVTLTGREGNEVTCTLKKTDQGLEADPSLDAYAITIEDGSYTDRNQIKLTYNLEVKAELETETLEDGTVQYTLILPDIQKLAAADQESVTNNSFKKTTKAVIKAKTSEENSSYVESEEAAVSWD